MGNDAFQDLKEAIQDEKIGYQLVPPHCHRTSLAERVICTFKSHFKTGLASLDPDFPRSEWDRLTKYAEMMLNLLCAANTNPKLSAYAYLFGKIDWNTTPLTPLGTNILAYNKPSNRPT